MQILQVSCRRHTRWRVSSLIFIILTAVATGSLRGENFAAAVGRRACHFPFLDVIFAQKQSRSPSRVSILYFSLRSRRE